MVYKVDADGATVANEFTNGNPSLGIKATRLEEDWHNMVQRELVEAVEYAGLTLNKLDDTQLRQAIEIIAGQAANKTDNLKVSLSSGLFKLVGFNDADLAANNVGRLNFPNGKKLTLSVSPFFEDDVGASDIIGNYFDTDTTVAWGNDRPFFLYGTYDASDNPYVFLSPAPNLASTSSDVNRISYHGVVGTTQDKYTQFFLTDTLTPANLVSRPCMRIGSITMTKTVTSDDWTVTGYNTDHLGIGGDASNLEFTMVTGHYGTTAGNYMRNNGGTAPVFTTNHYKYKILNDGRVSIQVGIEGDGGTDGAGAVDAQLVLPSSYKGNGDQRRHISCDIVSAPGSEYAGKFRPLTGVAWGDFQVHTTFTSRVLLPYTNFPGGARQIRVEGEYWAF